MSDGGNPEVRVFLLGKVAVEVEGQTLPPEAWRRKRPLELLKIVALAPGGAIHREEIIDRLWPDKDLEAGANNLHRALHDLRKAIGEKRILLDKGVVRLGSEVWVDVVVFEAGAASGDPARRAEALALYAGDLCPDDPYSDALTARRASLRQRFVDAALAVARADADDDGEAGMAALRRLVEIDPAQEEAQRMLMQRLAKAGRRQDALRQFAACTQALRESHDAAPSPETMRLREEILRGEIRERPAPEVGADRIARRLMGTSEPTQLRGRDSALSEVNSFIEAGEGVLLLLGEAGVGKTHLVAHMARLAERAGAVVLAGGASDLQDTTPYLAFIDAWSEYCRATGAPESEIPFLGFRPSKDGPAADKLKLFQSVEASLREIAGDRSVYLILEDLHWLDESSVHLLHFLARASRGGGFGIVATCREEEVRVGSQLHSLIDGLRRERLLRRVLLERLDRAATRAQIEDLLGVEASDALVASVFSLSGGNAFFTEEIVRAKQDSGGVGDVPEDLADTVRARVARHGGDVEALLVAASLVGQRFDFEVAREVGGLEVAAALDALEVALSARFVEEQEEVYRFHHALVRESLYAGQSRARRTHLHRRAAEVIAARTPDAHEDLARHFQCGGQLSEALPHLIAAGRRSVKRLGLREGVAFFDQALAVMDKLGVPPGPEWFDVLGRSAKARLALSDIGECVRDFDRAAELRSDDGWTPTPGKRAQANRLAALALLTGGDVDGARVRLERAMEALRDHEGDPEWPNVLYHLSQLYWHEARYREAYETAERCLIAAETHGDPKAIAQGYEMLALACHSLGEWKEGLDYEEKRQTLVGASVDVAQSFDVHL